MTERPEPSSPVARLLAGAAGGALAGAAVALFEIVLARSGPPLASPVRDASLLAGAGAVTGVVLSVLRAVPPLRAAAPAGIVLGLGIALHFWLGNVSGSRVLSQGAAGIVLRGALWIAAGAAAGQIAGNALRRVLPVRPHVPRDAFLLALLVVPAIVPRAPAPGDLGRPNVLLLTVDTLRADRLGYAGHPGGVSPHLDRLARRSTLYRDTVTPLPRTLPAMTSAMTGVHPHTHGVRDNFHYALGDDARTLAEILSDAGWECAAVNSNPALSHDSGIYQGFGSANDRGDDWSRLGIVRGAGRILTLVAMRRGDRDDVVTGLALRWLERRRLGRPFFLWVHWLAPHMPYEPAYPFDRRFGDPAYDGPYGRRIDYDEIPKGEMTYRNPLSPADRRQAVALYDGEVATSDRAVGRLLREMEARGDLRETEIVFSADHGESLLEHGYFLNHGDFVYGPAANVTLLRCGPDAAPGFLPRTAASLVDVLPMLLARTGLGVPGTAEGAARPAPGRRLFGESGFCRFPHLNDRLGGQLPREIAQSPERVTDWAERWAEQANRAKQRFVQDGDWKLVRSPRESGDLDELFHLATDPGETVDVSAEHPERTRDLADALEAWIAEGAARTPTAGERTLDDDTREQMEALGYVGE